MHQNKKAVFIDRDGTIIEDNGHIGSIEDVEFYPFAVKALKMLQEQFRLFIVTNQSGVGLGRIKKEEAQKINDYIMSWLESQGVTIEKLYCCSHKRDDNCECIKPKPYFIHEAQREYGIDVSKSFSIGDHPHDVEFGKSAGAEGIYVLTGHGKKHFGEMEEDFLCFEDLYEAAKWITAPRPSLSSPDRHCRAQTVIVEPRPLGRVVSCEL